MATSIIPDSRRKLALVIGIGNYATATDLPNAINDAEAISSALKSIGFILHEGGPKLNPTCKEIRHALVDFEHSIEVGDMILFYYAGHGIQWEGQNYLIPSDNFKKETNDVNSIKKVQLSGSDLKLHAINAQDVHNNIHNRRPFVTMLFLDCCRTYDLPDQQLQLNVRGKPINHPHGLKAMSLKAGSLIVFACAPGTAAYDGKVGETNGLFTKHLLKHIKTPNEDIRMVLADVTDGVMEESKSQQIPHVTSILRHKNICLYNHISAGQVKFKTFALKVRRNKNPPAAAAFGNAKHLEPVSSFSTSTTASRHINTQRMQNALLVWLDNNISEDNADCNNIIKQLKHVINNVNMFTDDEECIEFIQTIIDNKVCMITSATLGQHIVPRLHDISQVDSIFIFCNNQEWHKQWAKDWPKIKGVFTDITSICEALKQATHECEQNTTSISFEASNKKLDQLDPSFMYTQILKEIILTIKFEDKHFQEFITYCREVYDNDKYELNNVYKLQTTYKSKIPIWWYTLDAFLYRMGNQALRSMDVDIIVRMGFFIKDLHHDIQRRHSEQFHGDQSGTTFTVYRAHRLSREDFTEMTKTKGGLLSFNNFLSTSKNRDVSLNFAQQPATNPDLVGILFVMSINPTDSTTPFASVSDVSYFHTDDEVLFSMHTIFRIGDIEPLDEKDNLYQVNLTLINDNDQDIHTLTDHIRQETFPDKEGWFRLGLLSTKMGDFSKSEQIYEVLLLQTTNESDKACIYDQLGQTKFNQGQYPEALTYYEKSLAIYEKTLPSNHLNLAYSHNNIGLVYDSMGDYPKALSFHEKALEIGQQSLPSNHPDLGGSYNNIGMVYDSMGDYPKALSFHEKALAIGQQSLPSNHPSLGAFYGNMGNMYYSMGEYSRALSYFEKALAIQQQSLPSKHPDLALSCMGIGLVYDNMGDYPKALSFHEKALAIQQQSLPSSHADLSASYNNTGAVYENMGNYSKAHSFYERAVQIGQQSLPTNHANLQGYRKNLERIKKKL
ncbi:unnamed protein product [Adineta steineri]|uniref:Peptidase C14 caspase domain-containing protein n=1 Tax=Adineta steineri TaxID=433720 RepID=A0A815EZ78_9BILA|nr:unnamed protein product [Adineta steineri]